MNFQPVLEILKTVFKSVRKVFTYEVKLVIKVIEFLQ